MRKFFLLTAMVALMSTTAYAAMPVGSFGLGWVDSAAPIGFRYQIAEKIAGDFGVGFASMDKDQTRINVAFGLPIELLAGDRVALDFRPGFTLNRTSYDEDAWGPDKDATNDMCLHAWLMVHVMLTDNFGVNGAHGLDVEITDGGAADNTTDIMSTSADITRLGWYYWF